MVFPELGASVIVGESSYIVHTLQVTLLADAVGYHVGLAVYASHSGYDPEFVAYSHVAVFTEITLHFRAGGGYAGSLVVRGGIGIFEIFAERGGEIVGVYPFSGLYIGSGMSDRIAVFYHLMSYGDVAECEFVSALHVGGDFHPFERLTFFHIIGKHYRYIVGIVDFQNPFHSVL